ncbi:hypothetical protein [Vitiosangium sp. GDMCC 1.1324]|uniref:hypothetical protein n=1 Tax=Vitiosangium sp. (strain GDMCC 1.1324) TaxID=2138576 RepID=UPI000D336EDF|nr:hypothetical protein [Vitiosangium sp. GDMCC 1.1324]PTL82758.1 hypothetical protein DAT35_18495 [Vitiosangium sp. GDMCC 1.1324]
MTSPASPAPGLPRGIRFAAFVGLVLSAFTGFFALSESMGLGRLSEFKEASGSSHFSIVGDPAIDARISKAQLAALESMREPRSLVLGALSVACALVFVSAGRMLRPEGLPLERMRRMFGGAAIAAALLRTIDGAQGAVVARRMGPVLTEAMKTLPEFQGPASDHLQVIPWIVSASTVMLTALVAGTFALLGQYFRSERVRQAISAQDGDLAEEED